jgi:lathosterol oxidase
MLCEIGSQFGYLTLWATFTSLGLLSMIILSGAVFIPYYVYPTFERWQYKSNDKFPSPALVKKEIIHMCKGLCVATLCPTFTVMSAKWGVTNSYCGQPRDPNTLSLFWQAVIIFLFTDFVEYAYHWLGHRYAFLWSVHRHHHMFYNPTPFAVIADEYLDQFVRTTPMVILPAMLPINMDLLFLIFASLFYGYGVYLHWGYESPLLSAHNPVLNTAHHHYVHHAISAKGRPIYTGFFFKIWDYLFDSNHDGKCSCVNCRPRRTVDHWKRTVKPDYSVLLSLSWWLSSESKALNVDEAQAMGDSDKTKAP